MWIALAFLAPTFFTTFNINNILLEAAVIALMAFGSTVVMVTEQIDLSIGAVAGGAGVISAYLMVNVSPAWPWPLAVAAGLGTGVVVGLINGVFSTVVGVPSFIATLATLGIVTGIGLTITNGVTINGFPNAFQTLGIGEVDGVRTSAIIALAVLLILHFVMRYTRLGAAFYSVGDNAEAARRAGISPYRIKTYALVVSGFCSALAGILLIAQVNQAEATYGSDQLLNAIAAVVIGGTLLSGGVGSVLDTALGVLVIVTIGNGLDLLNVNPYLQQVAVGSVILIAVLLDRRRRRV